MTFHLSRPQFLRILRSTLEQLSFMLLSKTAVLKLGKEKGFQDIATGIAVQCVASIVVYNVIANVLPEDDDDGTLTPILTAFTLGVLVMLYCILSKKITGGKICMPTFVSISGTRP